MYQEYLPLSARSTAAGGGAPTVSPRVTLVGKKLPLLHTLHLEAQPIPYHLFRVSRVLVGIVEEKITLINSAISRRRDFWPCRARFLEVSTGMYDFTS